MLTEPSTGGQTLHFRNCHSLDYSEIYRIPYLLRDFAPIKNRDQSDISPT